MEASYASSPRVIDPATRGIFPNLREIWRHRDLAFLLARREVSGRYKQSVVGVFWAVLQPLLLATVFSVFLGLLAKVDSQPGVPYPVFAASGMVFWLFIAGGLQFASTSTAENEQLISKVYFPRAIIPFSYLVPALVDFAFAFPIVIGTMLIYGVGLHLQILLVPLLIVVAFATVLGAALWLSALNVKYRDVQHLLPFLVLLGLFMSPITYPFDLIPDHLQPLYALNPVVGLLEVYRWMLFGTTPSAVVVLVPVAACILLLLGGAAYFHRAERTFADII
jgi:lipopolysaccharide transport system permease protein